MESITTKRHKDNNLVGALDLYLSIALTFAVMMILAMTMMNPPPKKADSVRKAEFIVEMEWQDQSRDDVDIWIRDPMGNTLYYNDRQQEAMHLDKDDRGVDTDTITDEYGVSHVTWINREVATLRGVVPGKFTINVHMYAKHEAEAAIVKVLVTKLNPYRKIIEREIKLVYHNQEDTVVSFTINPDGTVGDISTSFEPFAFRDR